MTASHAVKLPYPDRSEPTVGTCLCGWAVVYAWGHHDDASQLAGDHIRKEDRSEPYELTEMSGTRYVRPGVSL